MSKQPAKLYVLSNSPHLESAAIWLRTWGLDGMLRTAGRKRYFDVTTPAHWSEARRQLFKASLKGIAAFG